jgi:hypothetical protein
MNLCQFGSEYQGHQSTAYSDECNYRFTYCNAVLPVKNFKCLQYYINQLPLCTDRHISVLTGLSSVFSAYIFGSVRTETHLFVSHINSVVGLYNIAHRSTAWRVLRFQMSVETVEIWVRFKLWFFLETASHMDSMQEWRHWLWYLCKI